MSLVLGLIRQSVVPLVQHHPEGAQYGLQWGKSRCIRTDEGSEGTSCCDIVLIPVCVLPYSRALFGRRLENVDWHLVKRSRVLNGCSGRFLVVMEGGAMEVPVLVSGMGMVGWVCR